MYIFGRWKRNFIIVLMLISGTAFQNCGKVQISELMSNAGTTQVQIRELVVNVSVNKPKSVSLLHETFTGTISLSDSDPAKKTEEFADKGLVELSPTELGKITFTPVFAYRGTINVPVYLRYTSGKSEFIKIVFQVQNPLMDFKPALVVRAAECILCHARVKGDVISDLGYKGLDLTGPDMFFRKNPDAVNATAYSAGHSPSAITDAGWGTANISGRLILPKVNFASLDMPNRFFPVPITYVENGANKTSQTLREYMDKILMKADPVQRETRPKSVEEKDSMYIGAPTADDIRQAGRLINGVLYNAVKNESDSAPISGIEHVVVAGKDFWHNAAEVVCDGDIFIDGVVFLHDLKIRTDKGCRIHATRTVFISGGIDYVDEFALSNLQIMSARAIMMGVGMCYDCHTDGNVHFNENFVASRATSTAYWVNQMRGNRDLLQGGNYVNTLRQDFLAVSNETAITRAPAGTADLKAYYEAQLRPAGIALVDVNSYFNVTNTTPFRRLMLNAPDVQSRYSGKFQGTIIAEFALWRLGQFTFEFDSVFTAVPIFPLMDMDKIIKIEN